MSNLQPSPALSDLRRELTSTFISHLSTIRQRLDELRRVRGYAAAVERRCLLQQEAAWQLGILLLRQTPGDELTLLVELLDANAQHGGPAGIAFATMGTIISIRSLWSSECGVPDGHPARGWAHG